MINWNSNSLSSIKGFRPLKESIQMIQTLLHHTFEGRIITFSKILKASLAMVFGVIRTIPSNRYSQNTDEKISLSNVLLKRKVLQVCNFWSMRMLVKNMLAYLDLLIKFCKNDDIISEINHRVCMLITTIFDLNLCVSLRWSCIISLRLDMLGFDESILWSVMVRSTLPRSMLDLPEQPILLLPVISSQDLS